jgi:hypothetical protein
MTTTKLNPQFNLLLRGVGSQIQTDRPVASAQTLCDNLLGGQEFRVAVTVHFRLNRLGVVYYAPVTVIKPA